MRKSGGTGKRYFLLFMALVLTAGILAGGYAYLLRKDNVQGSSVISDELVLAELDGEPVTYGEFRLCFPDSRSAVVSELNSRYGFDDSREYWTTPLPDGSTPLELAVSRTMEELRIMKARQILFAEYGICENISYRAFRKQWEEENERRADAIEKGQVIYGPERYDEARYFSYLMDQYQNRLEEILSQSEPCKVFAESPEKQARSLVQEKLDSAVFQPRENVLELITAG